MPVGWRSGHLFNRGLDVIDASGGQMSIILGEGRRPIVLTFARNIWSDPCLMTIAPRCPRPKTGAPSWARTAGTRAEPNRVKGAGPRLVAQWVAVRSRPDATSSMLRHTRHPEMLPLQSIWANAQAISSIFMNLVHGYARLFSRGVLRATGPARGLSLRKLLGSQMILVAVAIGVIANALLLIPIGLLFVEVLRSAVSNWPNEREEVPAGHNGAFAVIVPAHNEGANLVLTLRDIREQLGMGDRLVVVADNCTDDTAEIASREGAEVVKRDDPTRRGKGYALERGVQHLRAAPPDVVVIVDADCRLEDRALERLCATARATGRPAQALYLMRSATDASVNRKVAEFAWLLKNFIRPFGLSALGFPCHLMGTGMAFPWSVISSAELGTSHIVEDLKLGIELALAWHPPIFCSNAVVVSYFPDSEAAAEGQRKRWEQGHVSLLLATALPLLPRAIVERNWNLLGLLLDLVIPPATMLAIVVATFAFASFVLFILSGHTTPLLLSAVNILAFAAAVGLAWARFGRQILPTSAVLSILPYVVTKLSLYVRMLRHRGSLEWIRTERGGSTPNSN